MTTICDLPSYDLVEIFKFISDLGTLESVYDTCQQFRDIIETFPEVTRNLTLTIDANDPDSAFSKKLENSNIGFQNLRMTNFKHYYFPSKKTFSRFGKTLKSVTFERCKISKQKFLKMLSKAQSIETLRLVRTKIEYRGFETAEHINICSLLPNLKFVELEGNTESIYENFSFEGLKRMRMTRCDYPHYTYRDVKLKVQELEIYEFTPRYLDDDYLTNFESMLTYTGETLKYLKISSNNKLDMSCTFKILNSMKLLEEFELECFVLQRSDTEALRCPSLKRFKINTLQAFSQLLSGMPNLDTLTLNFPLSNILLKAIHRNCPALKNLIMAHNVPNIFYNIRFEYLESLTIKKMQSDFSWDFLAYQPRLQHLKIYDCSLKDDELKFIVQQTPQLKSLEIGYARDLTVDSLNPETIGELELLKIYDCDPSFVSSISNLKYYYYAKTNSEPNIDWLKADKFAIIT